MPKAQIAGILVLFFILATSRLDFEVAFYLFATCVGFTLFFDSFFSYIRKRKFFMPYAGAVTGLIFALVIDPKAAWYQILIICLGAMALKNFVRITNRHVLNPASSGLFVGWILFGLSPSWWGATLWHNNLGFNSVMYCLLAAIAYVSCIRLRRFASAISYLVAYGLLSVLFQLFSFSSALAIMISPGVLFYTLLMLPEPQTSPVTPKRQLLYGGFIASITVLLVILPSRFGISWVPDASIVSLLVGNIAFFRYR